MYYYPWKDRTRGAKAITIILAVVFIAAGGMKMIAAPALVEEFAKWHFPLWFMYAVGTVEIASVILLFTRYAFLGMCSIGIVMIGAAAVHVMYGQLAYALVPATILVLDIILARKCTASNLRLPPEYLPKQTREVTLR